MVVYQGRRTIDGVIITRNGAPMVAAHTRGRFLTLEDFEWGYEGEAARLLAYTLLADHLGDEHRAETLADAFMRNTVSALENEWSLDSAAIDAAIANVSQTNH